MTDITRYDIKEHGELPLSNGRYVRWEDVEDLLVAHAEEVDRLEHQMGHREMSYQDGYDEGWEDGKKEGLREGLKDVRERVQAPHRKAV